jgi:hypothetical protein
LASLLVVPCLYYAGLTVGNHEFYFVENLRCMCSAVYNHSPSFHEQNEPFPVLVRYNGAENEMSEIGRE